MNSKQVISPLLWFVVLVFAIGLVASLGPAEQSLGVNIRVVYLHVAWVWAALTAYLAAAVVGVVGLVSRREALNRWSRALGRTGLFFWITYLPLSLWAMQANWNGLFLAEPRWRLGVIFAIGGLILQVGLTLVGKPGLGLAGEYALLPAPAAGFAHDPAGHAPAISHFVVRVLGASSSSLPCFSPSPCWQPGR